MSALNIEDRNISVRVTVIDDGSDDGTRDVLIKLKDNLGPSKLNIFFYGHKGLRALPEGLNKHIRQSECDYLGLSSTDDYYHAGAIRESIHIFERENDVDVVFSDGIRMSGETISGSAISDLAREVLDASSAELALRYARVRPPVIYVQGSIFRGAFLRSFEPYDCDLSAEDWVFHIRLFDQLSKRKRQFRLNKSPGFVYRSIEGSTSKNRDHQISAGLEVFGKYGVGLAYIFHKANFSKLKMNKNRSYNNFVQKTIMSVFCKILGPIQRLIEYIYLYRFVKNKV